MFKRKVETEQSEAFTELEAARQYTATAEKNSVRYRAFLEHLGKLGIKGRYLEIGPGPGLLTATIAQAHPEVEITGVELSSAMVSLARDYVNSKGLQDRIEFIVGDAADESLIKSLGRFDLVYCTYTLHHWPEPEKVISNLMGGLAEGGLLFLHDLRRVWWLYWIPIRSGFLDSVRGAYLAPEVEAMLKGMGLEQFEVRNEIPFLLSVFVRK